MSRSPRDAALNIAKDSLPGWVFAVLKGTEPVEKQEGMAPVNSRGLTSEETKELAALQPIGKLSKADAAYIEPATDVSKVCGGCRFLLRSECDRSDCLVVEGSIAWFGSCEYQVSAEKQAEHLLTKPPSEEVEPEVFTTGPEGAAVMFVGESPTCTEKARREPLVGPDGATLRDVYLAPLGLERADVAVTNLAPVVGGDVTKWGAWFDAEVARIQPDYIVALGLVAKKQLGDRAFINLPHPSAVRRFGDRGEVGRKLTRLQLELVKKQATGEEGSEITEAKRAQENWDRNWHTILPENGKGLFVYQHHWRGLSSDREGVDETRLSDGELMTTDNSLHGDFRLSGESGNLFGWAVSLGTPEAQQGAGANDRLLALEPDTALRMLVKLPQPAAWLSVGKGRGTVIPPGGPGATDSEHAKFFLRESGTYKLGVATQDWIEFFLDGEGLQGRYLLTLPEVSPGNRVWLIDKPQDQIPRADQQDLGDAIAEQRDKGHRFLFWGGPNRATQKIDIKTGKVLKSAAVQIRKVNPVKRIVYGAVIDPYGPTGAEADAHNDWIPPADIEQSAHDYLTKARVVGLNHRRKAQAEVIESSVMHYPTRKDYLAAMKNLPHSVWRRPFGNDIIHSGAWVIGVRLGPIEWGMYERGEINAFSPGGVGVRNPLERHEMPAVKFIDLIESPAR